MLFRLGPDDPSAAAGLFAAVVLIAYTCLSVVRGARFFVHSKKGSCRRMGDTLSPSSSRGAEGKQLLRKLLTSSLILAEDWEKLTPQVQTEIKRCVAPPRLLALLMQHGLLTPYQADRIEAGNTFGLILGNYRILERL